MRILAAIEDPVVARKTLDSLGLPSPAPSCGSGSPQPTTHAHRILTVNRPPLPTCVGTLPSFRSCMRNLVCKSVCGPKIPLANSRQSGFARLGRRISVHAHEKTALDSPMLSDQFLTTPH